MKIHGIFAFILQLLVNLTLFHTKKVKINVAPTRR